MNADNTQSQKEKLVSDLTSIAKRYNAKVCSTSDTIKTPTFVVKDLAELDSLFKYLRKPQTCQAKFVCSKTNNVVKYSFLNSNNISRIRQRSIESGYFMGRKWVILTSTFLHVDVQWNSPSDRGSVSSYLTGMTGGDYQQSMGHTERVNPSTITFATDGPIKFTVAISSPVYVAANTTMSIHSTGSVNTSDNTGSYTTSWGL